MSKYHGDELSVTLFEEAGDALFLFDPESEQLLDANPMALRLTGCTRAQLLRTQISYLFRAEMQGGLQRLRQAYRKTGVFHAQDGFFLRHQNEGTWVPVNLTVTRLHARPKPLGLVTARDVRESRELLAQLKRTQAELQRVLASVSDCIWSAAFDSAGRWHYRYCSPVVEKISGRPPSYYEGGPDRWLATIHPDDRPNLELALARLREGKSSHEEAEYRVVRPDGTISWVRNSVQISRDPDGQSLHLDGIATDITARRQAEEVLRASEERFRKLVEKSADAIALVDAQGRVLYASPSTQTVLGFTPEEFVGRDIFAGVHPDDLQRIRGLFATCVAKAGIEVTGDFRYRHCQGHWVHIEGTGCNRLDDPGLHAIVANYRDVTPRKLADLELARERDRLYILMESIPHLIYFKDRHSRFTRINHAQMLNLKLRDPAEAIGKTDFDFYPEELAREFFEDEQRLMATGWPIIDKVERQTGDQANERWISSTKVPITGPDGAIVGLVGVSRDVTVQQRAEEAVRASESKYRSLVDNLQMGIFLKDRDGRYVAVNRYLCEAMGRHEAEILGKNDAELQFTTDAARLMLEDDQVLKEGRRLEFEGPSLIHPDRTARVIKTPVRDEQGRIIGVLGIGWDVTEQRALENQLRQAQKMDAVGQLAGGVAHDFNNLLTVILGNVSLLQAGMAPNDPNMELLAATEKAAVRAAELTSKLLGFSRRTTLRLEAANPNLSVEETLTLLRRTIDPRIQVVARKQADAWMVQADLGQLNQVLMNLCLNARDAMPDGGELLLETANVVIDEEAARPLLESRAGEFVRIRVRDTGHGIPSDVLPRIFEPFFTTKAPGKGTGLGLAMVFGIVKQHQGWISCQSQPGKGTCFEIFLPRFEPAAHAETTRLVTRSPNHGRETILLVDDEPMIRNLGRAILQGYGYQVLLAEDGRDAIRRYESAREQIDLVILDLTMPHLSGRDAFQRLRQINPEVPVIFASGYSAEQVSEEDHEQILGFVGKPYRPEDLARVVRTALDHRQRQRATCAPEIPAGS